MFGDMSYSRGMLGAVANVIKQVIKVVHKCGPPFDILRDFAIDIAKMSSDVNFRLRSLPFKIAKSLRRIIQMPLDIIRFCASVNRTSKLQ
jgi:hypothetical protein